MGGSSTSPDTHAFLVVHFQQLPSLALLKQMLLGGKRRVWEMEEKVLGERSPPLLTLRGHHGTGKHLPRNSLYFGCTRRAKPFGTEIWV